MKQLKLISTLGIAFVFLISSCGGNEEKTTDTSESDSAATTTTSESNIITTPENIVVVKHKVADFAKWKEVYDQNDSLSRANGIRSYVIGRSMDDSNNVMVAVKAEDIARAKAFSKDPALKAVMQKGGVTGTPSVDYTVVVYQDMSPNMSDIRSMTTFKVKDWEAWKTSFESNRQLRNDNGLTDRAYGYDADDKNKVTVVVAINDTAKARAFRNSDILKQKRAESGVVGEITYFTYRVVAKY